jgi:hypothetical protein
VLDACETADCDPYKIDPRQAGLAAALRAAVNQIDLLPLDAVALTIEDMIEQRIRHKLLTIATELEAH